MFVNNSSTAVALVTLLMACGGSEPEATAGSGTDEYTTGSEMADPLPPEDSPDLDSVEPEPAAPGTLTVRIRMANEDQAGTVAVMSETGTTVAEGNAGQSFELPSGRYRVRAMMDESVLPGHGSLEESATIQPGGNEELTLTYEVARIRLNVRRGGRAISRWNMVLTREGGDTEITMQPSTEHTVVAPGRYSGVLTTGNTRIEVSGLLFQGGATMDVPVNVN